MDTHLWAGLFIFGLCLSSGAIADVSSSATYDLTVAESIDTPTRTISFDGETHEVSAIGKATPGETLRVSVSAPSDADYRVNLYNGERDVMAQRPATGNSHVEFDLSNYEPGSYMLLLYKNGDYKDVYPVVVQGYETTISVPSRAVTDAELTANITVERTAQVEHPSAVKVVLATDEQTRQVTATSEGSQEYSATISLADIQPGQARMYAVIQGADDAFKDGRKELLGISDASTVTIEESTTQRPTETTEVQDPPTTDQTDSGSAPTSTTTATTTSSPSTQSMTLNTTTSTSTVQSTTTTTAVTTESQTTTTMRQSPTATTTTSTTTESSIITPEQSTTTTPEPSGQGIPGFGLSAGLIALVCAVVLLLRH